MLTTLLSLTLLPPKSLRFEGGNPFNVAKFVHQNTTGQYVATVDLDERREKFNVTYRDAESQDRILKSRLGLAPGPQSQWHAGPDFFPTQALFLSSRKVLQEGYRDERIKSSLSFPLTWGTSDEKSVKLTDVVKILGDATIVHPYLEPLHLVCDFRNSDRATFKEVVASATGGVWVASKGSTSPGDYLDVNPVKIREKLIQTLELMAANYHAHNNLDEAQAFHMTAIAWHMLSKNQVRKLLDDENATIYIPITDGDELSDLAKQRTERFIGEMGLGLVAHTEMLNSEIDFDGKQDFEVSILCRGTQRIPRKDGKGSLHF